MSRSWVWGHKRFGGSRVAGLPCGGLRPLLKVRVGEVHEVRLAGPRPQQAQQQQEPAQRRRHTWGCGAMRSEAGDGGQPGTPNRFLWCRGNTNGPPQAK